MDNTPIQAFITNLGKYNEGELVGKWIDLPTDHDTIQEALREIGLDGVVYEEYFFTDYETEVSGLYEHLPEHVSINELNYLAAKIAELQNFELEQFEAAIELGDKVSSIKDLINLTENLDCFDFLSGIEDHYDLGHYWIEESGCYSTEGMGNLSNYIDYERFGRDIAMEEGGAFTTNGYIRSTGDSFDEFYDGIEIPEEYNIITQRTSAEPREAPDYQTIFNSSDDSYAIFQLKEGDERRNLRFEPYERLIKSGHAIDRENYALIYAAPYEVTSNTPQALESIYERFNLRHPADFAGHSLSVSDVIALKRNGNATFHHCDSIGFIELQDFECGKNSFQAPAIRTPEKPAATETKRSRARDEPER